MISYNSDSSSLECLEWSISFLKPEDEITIEAFFCVQTKAILPHEQFFCLYTCRYILGVIAWDDKFDSCSAHD